MNKKLRQHAPVIGMAAGITLLGSACTTQEITNLIDIIKIILFFV